MLRATRCEQEALDEGSDSDVETSDRDLTGDGNSEALSTVVGRARDPIFGGSLIFPATDQLPDEGVDELQMPIPSTELHKWFLFSFIHYDILIILFFSIYIFFHLKKIKIVFANCNVHICRWL